MESELRLISTDFDGTLIGHPSDGRCVPALARALADFKAAGGLWAVNTGRSLFHTIEGLEVFQAPIAPDFLITHERELYHRNVAGEWQDFGDWNELSRKRHGELFDRSGAIFSEIHRLVEGATDVTLIEAHGHPAGLITSDETVMARVAGKLDALRDTIPKFSYQRNTIYLRFCHADYHKGSTLGELCRLMDLLPDEVFAAGDNYNDLSMLNAKYAKYLACPANAIPEVKYAVASEAGCVSSHHFGEGIAHALNAILSTSKTKKPAAV